MSQQQQTIFTPSGSESISFVPNFGGPSTAAMPAVDAGNPDTLIVNSTGTPIWLSFGQAAQPVGPNFGGNVAVQAGQAVLLTSKAAVLAAAAANPAVIGGGQAASAATGTVVSVAVASFILSGQLTITRGVAAGSYIF